jgi:polysaccharide biosynthesis protein PslG
VRRFVAVALAVSCVVGSYSPTFAAESHARRALIVGVNDHAMWSDQTDAQRLAVLDKLQAAGVRTIRMDVGWSALQPSGPGALAPWYVQRMDFVVNQARKRGIAVLAMLWSTPGWANGNQGPNVPPTNVATYAAVAHALAAHFRGRMQAWEVWNEPDSPTFFTGTAANYVALLRAAYPAIKHGDPNAVVVTGGPTYDSVEWVTQIYAAGAHGFFNVLATHAYQAPSDAGPKVDDGSKYEIARIAGVRKLMVQHGDGHLKIWFTEFGWSTSANNAATALWYRGVSEQKQAQYLVRMLNLVRDHYPYVSRVFWYDERDRTGSDPWNDHFGLLHTNLSPKPAYSALRNWTRAQ